MPGKVSEACLQVIGSASSGRVCLFLCATAHVYMCLCVRAFLSPGCVSVFLGLSLSLYLI